MDKIRHYLLIIIASVICLVLSVPVFADGLSDNEVSGNFISDNEASDKAVVSDEIPAVLRSDVPAVDATGHTVDQIENSTTFYVVSDNRLYLILSAVSADDLGSISANVVSINEVLNDEKKDIADINIRLSEADNRNAEYQTEVKERLLDIAASLSMDVVQHISSVSADSVSPDNITVSVNNVLSSDTVSAGSISLNVVVSGNTVSAASISSGDIDALGNNTGSYLKPIFYAIVACAVGIWCLLAVQVERLFFGRLH